MGPPQPEAPVDMSEGVEAKGRRLLTERLSQGPPSPEMQNMVVNGGRPYAPRTPTMPAEVAQPAAVQPLTRQQGPASPRLPMPSSITPPNSLSRGARPGAGSSLGGPVKVGRSANDPLRIAEQARRRGNIGPIMDLVKTQMQEDRADGRMYRSEARADANFERSEQRADARTEQQRRESMQNWERTQQAEDTRYQRGRTDSAADSAAEYRQRREDAMADEERRGKQSRETYPIIDPITGQKHEGHFMTGNGMMAPRKVPDAPLPSNFEPKSTNRDGTLYGPKEPVTMEPPKLPDGIQYEKDPDTGKITSGVYPKYDPQTGGWKLTRMDLNGDGVVSPDEQAAAAAVAPAKPAAAPAPSGGFNMGMPGLNLPASPKPGAGLQSVKDRFKK